MIPKELDDLIKEYLTDGIITSKERQVLLKKAQNLGLDVDEVDLYIDAQQQKVDQAADAAMRKAKGKTCPFCGASVAQLAEKCPECGKAITAEASKELKELLDEIEESLISYKKQQSPDNRAAVEKYIGRAKLYYGNNPKIQSLVENVDSVLSQHKMVGKLESITAFFENHPGVVGALVAIGSLFLMFLLGFILYLTEPETNSDSGGQLTATSAMSKASEALSNDDSSTAYTMVKKALQLDEKEGNTKREFEKASSIRKEAMDKFIEMGKYDDADACIHWDKEEDESNYYDFLSKCIDDMRSKGCSDSEIVSFVTRKVNNFYPDKGFFSFSKWSQKKVLKRLKEYIGIDPDD